MKNTTGGLSVLILAATSVLNGCTSVPSLESIKYGYSPPRAPAVQEAPDASDYNDMASGWTPESEGTPMEAAAQGASRQGAAQQPVLYGRDGTPVGTSAPGTVTETNKPINGGVATEIPGSRSTLLDLYSEAVNDREVLTKRNEDLSIALEMSETRANDMQAQLKSLQFAYDELGQAKQAVDQASFDMAARLATAQIARLEAERALLEATIEWRRMSADNNRPLTSDSTRGQRP